MKRLESTVPKQPRRMLLGVFDECAYVIMGSLTDSTKSFSDLLAGTGLPKSSLYVTLMKLVENGLVVKNGAFFSLSQKGETLYKTIYAITVKPAIPQEKTEVVPEKRRESTISKILGGIKRILRR